MSITMIGLDTAKSVFQVHAVDSAGQVVIRRKLQRDELLTFFERQGTCTVAMEACGAAHHWGRALTGLGHTVRLIAPEAVRPFVKTRPAMPSRVLPSKLAMTCPRSVPARRSSTSVGNVASRSA